MRAGIIARPDRRARKINTLLENIGTQIYLGSLVGNTARYFIESLPQRSRPTFSRTASFGSDGKSESEQVGQEKVDYFTTYELYRLPAGEWPALVYINDQPRRSPFLVDMSNAFSSKRCLNLHSKSKDPGAGK